MTRYLLSSRPVWFKDDNVCQPIDRGIGAAEHLTRVTVDTDYSGRIYSVELIAEGQLEPDEFRWFEPSAP